MSKFYTTFHCRLGSHTPTGGTGRLALVGDRYHLGFVEVSVNHYQVKIKVEVEAAGWPWSMLASQLQTT